MEQGAAGGAIGAIKDSRMGIGDVGGVGTDVEYGEDVAFDGVADHEEMGGVDLVSGQKTGVGGGDLSITQFDGGFDGGEREAFDAVVVASEVATFGVVEGIVDFDDVVVVRE